MGHGIGVHKLSPLLLEVSNAEAGYLIFEDVVNVDGVPDCVADS